MLIAVAFAAETHIDLELPRPGEPARDPLPVRISFDPSTPAPHPVIVWSHGLFGSREAYDPLVDAWIAAGYVVARPTHDDSLALRSAKQKLAHLREPDVSNWSQRPLDVRRVLDALPAVEGLPALDLERIGVGGHSFGAQTAQLVAGVRSTAGDLADPRPDAFLWISPQGDGLLFDAASYPAEHRPVLMITGSKDLQMGGEKGAAWRMTAWSALAPPAWLLFVDDGEHAFGGISGHVRRGVTADRPLVGWIASATTGWWDQALRASPSPWFAEGEAERRSGGRLHVSSKP